MNNNKNLLKEGTIRRFMKLAGTDVLAGGFLSEGGTGKWGAAKLNPGNHEGKVSPLLSEEEEETSEEDVLSEQEEELEVAADEPPAEAVGDELVPPEPEADLELGDAEEEVEPESGSVEGALKDVLDAIRDVASEHGVEIDVEETEEPPVVDVGEVEPEPEEGEGLELGGEEGGELDMGEPEEDLDLQEVNYIDEDALMQEVYKRVRKRVLKEKRADDMATVLAEKISKRLARKRKARH